MKDFNKDNLSRRGEKTPKDESREIELFVRRSKNLDRITQAKAESLDAIVKEHDLEHIELTGKQISDIANGLGLKPSDLIDKDDEEIDEVLNDFGELNEESSILFLTQNLKFMKSPIAKRGDKYLLIKEPTQITQLQKQLK